MNHDPIDLLRTLDEGTTTPLDDARRTAIEARVVAGLDRDHRPAPASVALRTGRRPLVLVVAAAACALLVVAVAFAGGREDARRLELAAASGVTLERPDAVPSPLVAGDHLPDGAIMAVAPGGSASVAGRTYGPGRYEISDGELRPLGPVPTSPPVTTIRTSATTAPTTPPPTSLAPAGPSVRPAPVTTEPATTITREVTTTDASRPDRSTTVPSRDAPPDTTVAVTRPPPTTTTPATTTTESTMTTTTVRDRRPTD